MKRGPKHMERGPKTCEMRDKTHETEAKIYKMNTIYKISISPTSTIVNWG